MKAIAVVSGNEWPGESKENEDSLRRDAFIDIPDSCLIRSGKPFFIPEFDSEFGAYCSLAVRISRLGKCIAPRFAGRYWEEFSIGVSIRGDRTLAMLREQGLPWSGALVFDRSLILGDYLPKDAWQPGARLSMRLQEDEIDITRDLTVDDIDAAIALVSRHNTIRQGDIILVRLSSRGLPLSAPSRLTADFYSDADALPRRILSTNIR